MRAKLPLLQQVLAAEFPQQINIYWELKKECRELGEKSEGQQNKNIPHVKSKYTVREMREELGCCSY